MNKPKAGEPVPGYHMHAPRRGQMPVLRADSEAVERARELYEKDGIEISDSARVQATCSGTWVQAWVLVPNEET